ncbi:MAG: SGNH/GDSL hydrolase family protein [Lachnospiraceae bacterium]|nr:SGNH/GDSL hydrolase family protein [Lachnospiraceae bacterium]
MQDFKSVGKELIKNLMFLIILFMIFVGVLDKLEAAAMKNDNLVQSRNKSIFRILREPQNTVDVIVLGDSLSYSAISPMELWKQHGMTAYICGQAGQKIQETYHMLETAFQTQSPKLVILESNVMFRGESGFINIKEAFEEWGNRYIPIIRSHDIWKSFFIEKQYPEENYKGFTFRCSVQPYKNGKYMVKTKGREEIPDIVLTYMEKIQRLCEEKGAELMLLGTPSPLNCNYSRHNSLSAYAKENHLKYLDLNLKLEEVGIDWKTDSLDGGDHLNFSGAGKVTRYLGTYLKSRWKFLDHRTDQNYTVWEKELVEYEEKAKKKLEIMKKRSDKINRNA